MSSETKDPLEKQDTSSESSESPSNSEVENLEHLQIEEPLAKNNADESKPSVSPNQEGTHKTKDYELNEPTPGPSGLQGQHLPSSDLESKDVMTDPNKEDVQVRGVGENIGDEVMEGDSDTTSSTPSSNLSSSSGFIDIKYIRSVRGRLRSERSSIDKKPPGWYDGLPASLQQTSSSRRQAYATDSAHTSSDISELRSEVADSSREESVYEEAPANFQREDSPSVYESAVDRLSSEASDASELQDESVPIPSSVSISTNTGEQGNQAYLAKIQREAEERGVPMSSSSGQGSTNLSELAHLQRWGEKKSYRPNLADIIDSPNQERSEHVAQGEELQPTSGCMQDLESQRNQEYDEFQQKQRNEESNLVDDEIGATAACRMKQVEEKMEVSHAGETSSPVRRKSSKYVSSENLTGELKQSIQPENTKESNIVTSKSSVTSQSNLESIETKSSSSDKLHRKSPEIESLSEAQDPSQAEKGRKSWQKSGQLKGMRLSTVSSKDSALTEEEDPLSPLRGQSTELMETKDITPEKMETTPEKGVGNVAKTEPSESKPSALSFRDQACGSEAEATQKEHDSSFEISDFERPVRQTKRPGGKLSSSPPSDGRLSSTPPKEPTRPKKKARAEKKQGKGRRTRTDSGGSIPTSVSLDRLKRDDSSDYTASDDDKETKL